MRKESEWSKLVKQYGVKGAKKRREELEGLIALKRLKDATGPIITTEEILTEIEEKPIEQISEKDALTDIRYRSDKVKETVLTKGWREYIRPRIEGCITVYKTTFNPKDVKTYEDWRINMEVREELVAILEDIDRWVNERKELEEEEKDASEK